MSLRSQPARALWLVAGALAVALVLVLTLWRPDAAQAPGGHTALPVADAPGGGDFTLTGPEGVFELAELRGEAVLIYFGYSWCPDACPMSLAVIAQALDALSPEERARTRGLFISVDPERDTPERLAEYATFFHSRMIGVSGQPEELAAAGRRYGAVWYRVEGGTPTAYLIDHTSASYLVDPDGRLAATFPHGTPASRLVEATREVLGTATTEF
ncbi:MAG: SCO family protein [Gammaproteobacteria bacterium]|nr:MAG: SCO family protein [Gammaproteobacteria bacterium]